jgi:nucleoside-diphosphate-sugar epimerase
MILVTGATGLSGSYVVEELVRRGLPVRALVRDRSRALAKAMGVEIAVGDLADPESLTRASEGVAGIVHAACTLKDSKVDIAAMQALLRAWQDGPFVFFSSLDVYGFSKAPLISEDEALDASYNDYARGKVVSERLLEEAAKRAARGGVSILRAPHIWAPHPVARKRLLDWVTGRDALVLPGADEAEWSQYRDAWVDARDLAWIVAECLTKPIGGPVNVLAEHFVWHDLLAEVIRCSGLAVRIAHKPLSAIRDEEQPRRLVLSQTWRYDDAKLRGMLSFAPTRTWQATVAETLAAGGPPGA